YILPCSSRLLSIFTSMIPRPPRSTLSPYTTLFRSKQEEAKRKQRKTERRQASKHQPSKMVKPKHSVAKPPTTARSTASPTTSKRSEEHTSELQSRFDLVCRLLLEKKNNNNNYNKAQ